MIERDDSEAMTARYLTRGRWVFLALAAIAGALLIAEHLAHVVAALPYLVILACPLLHVFMHRRGHGHHGNAGRDERHGT